MLVLTRKREEGDSIRITVVAIQGDKVRLGIEAPPDVPVHRLEIHERIKRETEGESCPQN